MNYVTRKQASEILNVHFNTIYGMAKSGKIKSVMVGKQKRYDISEYVKELKLKTNISRENDSNKNLGNVSLLEVTITLLTSLVVSL